MKDSPISKGEKSNVVYKYLPPERVTYFDDELLRITQPGDLNDPFEFLGTPPTKEEIICYLNERFDSEKKKLTSSNKIRIEKRKDVQKYKKGIETKKRDVKNSVAGNERESFCNTFKQNLNDRFGILSLSRKWNNVLMWAHYTDSHKGFCVGFDSSDPFFYKDKESIDAGTLFRPVNYSEKRIKVSFPRYDSSSYITMFTKSIDWKYEKEERLVVLLSMAHEKKTQDPYDICLYKVPHRLIKEIVLGAKIEPKISEKIVKFCKGTEIVIYRSKISETDFNMERE